MVEDAVNAVGVDLNTASSALLARVSGLGASLAEAIVAHRDANGPFDSRKALMKVNRLGPRAFQQCAGFLRIRDGGEPLDASAVHPEAYTVAKKIVAACGRDLRALMGDKTALKKLDPKTFVDETFGLAHGARHSARTGETRPRPAPRVQDGDLRRRDRGHQGSRGPACGWKGPSPMSRPSGPSSISACIRTG